MTFAIFVTSFILLAAVTSVSREALREEGGLPLTVGIVFLVLIFAGIFGVSYSIAQFANWVAYF